MKLVLIITNDEFRDQISEVLSDYDIKATLVSSSGDFLQFGEDVYLLGIQEEEQVKVESCMQEIKERMNKIRDFQMYIYIINMNQMSVLHPIMSQK